MLVRGNKCSGGGGSRGHKAAVRVAADARKQRCNTRDGKWLNRISRKQVTSIVPLRSHVPCVLLSDHLLRWDSRQRQLLLNFIRVVLSLQSVEDTKFIAAEVDKTTFQTEHARTHAR